MELARPGMFTCLISRRCYSRVDARCDPPFLDQPVGSEGCYGPRPAHRDFSLAVHQLRTLLQGWLGDRSTKLSVLRNRCGRSPCACYQRASAVANRGICCQNAPYGKEANVWEGRDRGALESARRVTAVQDRGCDVPQGRFCLPRLSIRRSHRYTVCSHRGSRSLEHGVLGRCARNVVRGLILPSNPPPRRVHSSYPSR